MKKKVFSLMMMLLLAFVGFVRADELTVNDGTTTNGFVPVYGFYADAYLKCEFVQPAADLAAVNGGTINSLTFFASDSNVSWGNANFQVFVTEVADASISAFAGPGTVVYTGALSIANGQMVVNFTTPYTYNGGNLLVGVYNTVTGSYVSCSWYGVSATGASVQGYSYTSLSDITASQRNFLPKMKIDYTAGGGGGGGLVEDQLHVKYMDGEEEVIDSLNLGVRPINAWMEPFEFTMYTEGRQYTVTVLDFTPSDGMFSVEGQELPFQVVDEEGVQLTMGTNATEAGIVERQFVAITEGNRSAHIWPVVVELYTPVCPDVWELACEEATEFPFVEVPQTAHNMQLHNDYTLPFPEIPEGYDAVYKLVFDQDVMLNASVTQGENGKVALYREGFEGEGGPMADNYYTGPSANGGGATGGSFEAMIGDETSTTTSTYFPFHTLWNYSIGENLFLASELTEAGVTTAPMTSLSWYVSSTTCTTAQNGISIWMANVSDSELTATSHTTAGMTLVYTGADVLPVAGQWNEFEFNAGNFAWDGHSNVLVVCQRLNGDWEGSVSWQTHNPGFTAMTYDYDDYEVYDMTSQTYPMYTSATNRANIIFKANGRAVARESVIDFEDGIFPPEGWTYYGSSESWYVDSEDYFGAAPAYAGSYSLYIDGNGNYDSDYLVSPAIEFNGSAASVSFAYATPDWSGDYNDLSVVYGTSPTGPWTYTSFQYETSNSWTTATVDLSSLNGTYYIAFESYDGYGYCTAIDDINIDVPTTPTPGPEPTPAGDMAYGPEIVNAAVEAGTYYLVASSTDADLEVTINAEDMPCPDVEAEGFAFNPTPADDADEVEPGSVTLRWNIPAYATGWRLVFGSTYYPDPNHPQTIMYPEDGTFATELANSYTVRNLWNNTNYFWHVEFNNDGCPDGVSSPIWGFTTHLNIPTNLTAVDYTVFDDEQIVLNWNAVVDRTYRFYNVYRDGELIGNTQVNNISNSTYTDGPLEYNMEGYTYYVTAVYDEGESAPSDPVTVKVSGYGNVDGHVYEQDGTTGIAGATVTMIGQDEFGVSHTYNFTTNAQGYYTGHIYAGPAYDGQAAKDGYQTAYVPVQGEPIVINYDQTTSPIDYILDENFDPVCGVIAEYYPDSLDPNSPYVKVYWGCGLPGSEIIEPFETGDFSLFDWQIDPTYPWVIDNQHAYEGTYCMKSGNQQVLESTSTMQVTVNIPADGIMSFFGKISCENSWDYGYFYIDGVQRGSYTGESNWSEKTFDITAGDHTFKWEYTEDYIISQGDDCFYVDYITFYKQPEPAIPGMTYDFDNSSMQGWTSVDADGDGKGWMLGSELMSGVAGHNGSPDFVFSQSYDNSTGVLYPDNYLVSPQVQLGGIVRFYACAQDASYAAEHFGLAVSTTNTNPSSFTMVQEWTMSAKSVAAPAGRPIKGQRSGREQGNWYEYTVDLSAYSGNGYVAIRHFNCSDMFYLDVDDITIGEPGKGMPETRSLDHYRVYRTNCYNDGPYTAENTVLLATVWVPDTVYIDVEWADLEPGVYKWGVGAVYSGNRGELTEGEINWTEPINVNNGEMGNRAEFTYGFEGGLEGWTVMDAPGSEVSWVHSDNNPGGYDYTVLAHGGTGFALGYSFVDYDGAYQIDSYLVSPQMYSISAGSSISFWADNANDSYPESFSVCVATAANPTIADFTTVWTGAAKGNTGIKSESRHDGNRYENWRSHSVDLNAYAGQQVWIAFHDVNYDAYEAWIDDVVITAGGAPTPGPTPGTGNLNELALPRESETIWSNCLDKDMWLNGVTVNVLLNSADSPEGTTVDFTNLNEVEQQNYPVSQLVLDESGYYAFESFRRGEYAVKVRHEGYEPIDDTVSIWENTDLRYVMTEIFYGIENLYVSRTGWAMWDDSHNTPGGGGGGGGQGGNGDTFSVDFEAGMPAGWTTIDGGNPTGYGWQLASNKIGTGYGHNGSTDCVLSQSYDNNYGVVYPDNYLVSPQVTLAAGSTFSFWACGQDASYAAEHFGVFVSDNGTSNWTMVNEWTIGQKGERYSGPRGQRDQSAWTLYSVDLSNFAGQKYIAIRHFNCSDMFYLDVDDIELSNGAKDGDRHLEYYKVMCTSIDGVPIFNHNTTHPFCQLSTNEPYNAPLVEGEHYLCKVACMYTTGLGAWSDPVEWVYEPCDHWGPVDEVTVNTTGQGNHVQWVFEHGFNPYGGDTPGPGPQPGAGDWYYYDNGVNVDAVGLTAGGSFYWGVMFPAGSYEGNMVTKVSMYDYSAHTGNILVYQGGSTAPGTLVGQQAYTCTGSEDFVEWEFAAPVAIDPTQNLWIVMNNNNGQYVASACDNTGDANGRWVSIDGTAWEDIAAAGLPYTWMIRAYVAAGAKGEPKAISYNGNSSHSGTFAISGNGPRIRRGEAVSYVMISESALMFNITEIANFDGRVYFLHKLYNDSRFNVINAEENGSFIVSANGNANLEASFADFAEQTTNDFARMNKYQAADYANEYKGTLPMSFVNSLMMDMYIQSRENNLCSGALPFCTDNGMYEFPAGVNAGSGETGPDYDCLYTTPNPAWYYMRIGDPGAIDIYMYSTPAVDIDFCCWGPFDDPETPCPNGLTSDKVVSCSYSAQPTEHCMIPATAQTGEYYILVITNYSNQTCNINFSAVGGAGSTDCGILPPVDIIGFLITQDGEYVAFAGPTDREYTVEGEFGEHEYCVRPIYPGEMVLPDHNYGWSMGCPVCASTAGDLCAPVTNLVGEYRNVEGMEGLYVDWEEPEGAVSFILYLDGEQAAELGSGEHPIFIALPNGFPAFTMNVGVVAVYEDCVSEMEQVDIFYDDVIENEANVALYPNPTKDNVTIEAAGMSRITVVSMLGQVVYDTEVSEDTYVMNMSQFTAGMYMVRVYTENGMTVKRVTVMR